MGFYKVYMPSDQSAETEARECCETTTSEATKTSFLKSKGFVWLIALLVAIVFTIEYFPNSILGI